MKKLLLKKKKSVVTEEERDELQGYASFTEKEIFSQHILVKEFTDKHIKSGKLRFDNIKLPFDKLRRIYIIGNDGNYACALASAYNAEVLCDIISCAESISEFVNSNPILDRNTLVIIISDKLNSDECIKAVERMKNSSARRLFVLSNDEERNNVISVGTTENGDLPCPSFLLKYLAISMLLVYIGSKNKIITELYKTVALNSFLTISDKLEAVLSARSIISQVAERIETDQLAVTGIGIDYAQSIYAALLLSKASGDMVIPVRADYSHLFPKLLGFISSIQLGNVLLENASPDTIILPENIRLIDRSTISYEETIPLLNPIISTAVIQMIAYFK